MSLVEAKEAFVVSWGDSLNVFACRRRDVNCLSCPSVGRWTRTDPSNLLLLNRVAASSDITEVVSAPRPVKGKTWKTGYCTTKARQLRVERRAETVRSRTNLMVMRLGSIEVIGRGRS
jgi:hypothetical protein